MLTIFVTFTRKSIAIRELWENSGEIELKLLCLFEYLNIVRQIEYQTAR